MLSGRTLDYLWTAVLAIKNTHGLQTWIFLLVSVSR
jgi:hypothetical protein